MDIAEGDDQWEIRRQLFLFHRCRKKQLRLTHFYRFRLHGRTQQFTESKRRLELLFVGAQFDDVSEPSYINWFEEVLSILERNKALAGECFDDDEGNYGFPLLHMVLHQASLAQIKKVYEMNIFAVWNYIEGEDQYSPIFGVWMREYNYVLHQAGSNCSEVICFLIDACPEPILIPDMNWTWAFHYACYNCEYIGRDWFTCKKLLGIGTANPVQFSSMFLHRTIEMLPCRLYDIDFLLRIAVSMPYGKDCCYPPLIDGVISKQSFGCMLMIISGAEKLLNEDWESYDQDANNHVLGFIYSLLHFTDIWLV